MPALERWLARGAASTRPEGEARALLATAFGLAPPVPDAAIELAADGAAPQGEWVRVDPVHLQVRQDAVALHDAGALGITQDEAAALVATLRGHFAPDGLEWRIAAPERWYARVPAGESPAAIPVSEARGRNLFGLLPRGTGRINWASALTEAQMLFAAHPVNAEREGRGAPAINGVWFWGGGPAPATVAKPYALAFANDDFTRGLAALSATRWAPEPDAWPAVDAVREGETVLVHLARAVAPMRRGDRDAHAQALATLDERFFVTLPEALARFEAANLILPRARDTLVVRVKAGDRWKWHKRTRALADHA